jgi:hypothetical protein
MRTKGLHFKAENDLRELPTYGIPKTAHYLQIPGTTLRSSVVGRSYLTEKGTRFFEPLIEPPEPNRSLISFMNVVEIRVAECLPRSCKTSRHQALHVQQTHWSTMRMHHV